MRPDASLARPRDFSFTVSVVEDRLRVSPASRLTDVDRDALRTHRVEILTLLAAAPTTSIRLPAYPPPHWCCRGSEFWLRPDGSEWVCGACHMDPRTPNLAELMDGALIWPRPEHERVGE